jgi:hypothetical protein
MLGTLERDMRHTEQQHQVIYSPEALPHAMIAFDQLTNNSNLVVAWVVGTLVLVDTACSGCHWLQVAR